VVEHQFCKCKALNPPKTKQNKTKKPRMFQPGIVTQAYNSNTQKAEATRHQSLTPVNLNYSGGGDQKDYISKPAVGK
jgi:hypothetical protein